VSRIGLPVEVIIRLEEELAVDLVVMATHGRSRSSVGHLLLGSVAERVVRRSRCPVLVVPPP
jgi:nucleotide-binding universal stress UspA family protein